MKKIQVKLTRNNTKLKIMVSSGEEGMGIELGWVKGQVLQLC